MAPMSKAGASQKFYDRYDGGARPLAPAVTEKGLEHPFKENSWPRLFSITRRPISKSNSHSGFGPLSPFISALASVAALFSLFSWKSRKRRR